MIANYSFRYLLKNRGNSVTRLVSLALGLIVALLICSYVGINLSYGRFFPDRDRVYQVHENSPQFGLCTHMLEPLAPTLAEGIPQIEAVTNFISQGVQVKMGNDIIESYHLNVSSDFFKVLDFGVISGDVERVLSNEGLANNEVMISERLSDKVFGKNDPLGNVIELNGKEHVVAGVFCTPPVTNPIGSFDVVSWLKYSTEKSMGWNGGDSYPTYVKLHKGVTLDEADAALQNLIEKHDILSQIVKMWQAEYFFTPIEDAYYIVDDSIRKMQIIYGILAVLALLVGTLNYVLLTLSSLASRSRTVAMLRCSGASRGDIFRMLLSETFIMIVASILLVAFILLCLSNQIYQLLGYHLNEFFALERIWIPALVCIVSFLLAGLIPAVLYSRVNLEYAFKRGSDNRTWWKRILLFVQVACTTAVVCFLLVTARQSKYVLKADVGYKYDNVITMNYNATQSEHSVMMDEIRKLPCVENAALSMNYPISGYWGNPVVDANKMEILFSCRFEYFDENYIDLMQMEIIAGRNFNAQDASNKTIVNEKFVHQYGWDLDSAIGKSFLQNGSWNEVIGVVRDYMQVSGLVLPLSVYHTGHATKYADEEVALRYNIRLTELSDDNIKALDEVIKKNYHSEIEYTLRPYADMVKSQFTHREDMRNNVLVISLVTLLISLIGLVGYLGNEMSRRRKEIAIRKVNGATSVQVLRLLGLNLLWVIVPAIITGVVGAIWGGLRYIDMLETMCEPLASWTFILGAGIVLFVVYGILIIRTWRAANENPIDAIN